MDSNFKRERLNGLNKEQLIKIILSGRNIAHFPGVNLQTLNSHPPDVLINMIMNAPGATVDNNMATDLKHRNQAAVFDKLYDGLSKDPRFFPDMWKAKPHQIEHIERIVRGLMNPTNESRSFLDMSDMGLGKTVTTILSLIRLKVRYVLIICPKRVIPKWHKALAPLGLFDYRICTYSGIIGAGGRGQVRWARHINADNSNKLEDMNWLQIRRTGRTGAGAQEFDWSFLPDTDQYGLGGCVVVWDEAQSVKNNAKKSQASICHKAFIDYMQSQQAKYIRCIMLSGTVMEKTNDLPYVLHALGYIKEPTVGDKNGFVRDRLGLNFQETMGQDWIPEMGQQVEGDRRLLLFLRGPAIRQGRVSYMVGSESNFENPITFQGLQVRDEDIAQFMRINQDIQYYLLLAAADSSRSSGVLGKIQKLLSELEVLKLVPIIEVARKALFTPLENGAQGSVCFAMTRTASARYLAWRLEAILFVNELQKRNTSETDLRQIQEASVIAIMRAYMAYNQLKPLYINARKPLPIKNDFMQYTEAQLRGMTMEDLRTEFNRWIKYLNPAAFEFVSVFVANMGKPNPSNFDLESADEKDWVKENAALSPEDLEGANLSFQTNRKRVFIANIQIARTGIDLHDTSGGEAWVVMTDVEWITVGDLVTVDGIGVFAVTHVILAQKIVRLDHKRVDGNSPPGTVVKAGTGVRNRYMVNGAIHQAVILNEWVVPEFEYGMHPRTAILGPGLSAMDLEQMLGRFVRVGQMSETLRIVAYIGNLKGEMSWEAKFMEKMHVKIANLQLLHKGTIKLDVLGNMAQSGDSIFKEIVDEIKYGGLGVRLRQQQQVRAPLPRLENDDTDATDDAEPVFVPSDQAIKDNPSIDAVGDLIKATFGRKKGQSGAVAVATTGGIQLPSKATPGVAPFRPQDPLPLPFPTGEPQMASGRAPTMTAEQVNQLDIPIKMTENYLFFVVNNYDQKLVLSDALVAAGFNPEFMRVVEGGLLIYRPGFGLSRLSQTETIFTVMKALPGAKIAQLKVDEAELEAFNFKPVIVVPKLSIVFESPNSMRVDNEHPLLTYIYPNFYDPSELKMERMSKGQVRFTGTTSRIFALFYALRMIVLYEAPQIFKSIDAEDPNGTIGKIDRKVIPVVAIVNGDYRVYGDKIVMHLFPWIVASQRSLFDKVASNKVMVDPKAEQDGRYSWSILPEYQSLINTLLGRQPENQK